MSATTHPFLDPFAGLARELGASGPAWLGRLRREALARFEQLGFPTSRLEEWKGTNVAPIAQGGFQPAPRLAPPLARPELPPAARLGLGGPRLVFVDGRFVRELSTIGELPAGLWVGSLAEALRLVPERIEAHLTARDVEACPAFVALNTALAEDGAVVLADEGVELDRPIELVYGSRGAERPTASYPRTLIVAGNSSRLAVVESHCGINGAGAYFTNAAVEIVVGDDAAVEHLRLQLEGPRAFHVSHLHSRQGRASRVATHNVDLGGRLVRNDLVAVLDGEGAECRLNGLYLTRDEQHVDNHTVLDHAKPHGASREVYKGILGGRSRTVFNGRIVVRPQAQKTDAKQSNRNLLLSPTALANTRPQLEIHADDVKCTHGATIGRLDDDAVFYLRSRGIDHAAARALLIGAFAGEVLDAIGIAPLRAALERAVAERLAGAEV